MKIPIYIFLFLMLQYNSVILGQKRDACKIYQDHIKVIENLFNGKETSNLNTTVSFLETITGIESEVNRGIEILYAPTDQNLKDWKAWYKKNKKRLYWDEKEQKVKVRELKKTHR